jgi:hypothetical protein
MTYLRHQFRVAVARRGLVTQQQATAMCEVLDLTEQGVQFCTELSLRENEKVRIECQLDEHCIIQCELLITHARPPHFGGRITHLIPEHQQQLASFVRRLILSSMAGL